MTWGDVGIVVAVLSWLAAVGGLTYRTVTAWFESGKPND